MTGFPRNKEDLGRWWFNRHRFTGGNIPPAELAQIDGQSNGVASGAVVYTSTPSLRHYRFTPGVRIPDATTSLGPLIGLYEQSDAYGNGGGGETCASGFAQTLDSLNGSAKRLLLANQAYNAYTIGQLVEPSVPYTNGMNGVNAAVSAAPGIKCTTKLWVHGESDAANIVAPDYYATLLTHQDGTDADVKAATGQADEVVFYCTQCCHSPPGSIQATLAGAANKVKSPQLMVLKAAVDEPTRFVCVGPTFWVALQADGLHWLAVSHVVIGGLLAKFKYRKDASLSTAPLYPTAAVRTGASIVVTFNVPVSPLAWRLDLWQNTTSGNTGALLGFKFYDDGGSPPAVTAVEITAANQVTVTLAGVPLGGGQEIRIGHSTSQNSGTGGTPLADSDTTVDAVLGYPLPNFCCMSYLPVTV